MRILITGCNGFIGRNMSAYLQMENPTWKIDGWVWHADKAEWPKVIHYDWVIHLGAAGPDEANLDQMLLKNLDFSQWLFNECQHHGVHLQYASSCDVYGDAKKFSEYSECNPQTPYAWSKFLFDRWVFLQPHNTSYVQGFRYFNVYGKWMHLKGEHAPVMSKWRQEARANKTVTVWDCAEHIKRDWVWVGDICKLQLDFINTVKGSGLWNVGSGLSHSYLDIAEEIAEQEGAKLVVIPTPENIGLRSTTCADLSHLKETIGRRKWLNLYEWLDTE